MPTSTYFTLAITKKEVLSNRIRPLFFVLFYRFYLFTPVYNFINDRMDTRFCFVYQLSQRIELLKWCRIDNIFIIQEWGGNRKHNPQYKMIFFFPGCFCDILIRGRIRPERKYYVTKIICFFQERNRFVNCSNPGASFYVLGQTG